MARTEKAESLAEESQSMADAMATVLRIADRQGTVQWGDVSDDISSGEWGRLIEQGILVDTDGDGFVVDDPEGVRDALGEDAPDTTGADESTSVTNTSTSTDTGGSDEDEDEDGGWTMWDKLAGLATLGLFLGYQMSSIRDAIGGTLDLVLAPLAGSLPFYVLIIALSVFTGLNSTILQSRLADMEKMAEQQEVMKDIQERRKEAKERGDEQALDEIQEEQMEAMGEQMGAYKEMFRPMVWIMLVNIPVFLWIYYAVQTNALVFNQSPVMVMPIFGEISSWQSRIGPMWSWIIWYFICSISFNQIVRKALDIQTTPDTS